MNSFEDLLKDNDLLLEAASRLTPQWVAGFFDGEGCVSPKIEHYGTSANIRVTITQKNPAILGLLCIKFLGGSIQVKNRIVREGSGSSRVHELWYTGNAVLPLLEFIKDHVIVKKELVLLGIELAKLVTYSGGKLSEAERSKRLVIAEKIRAINRKNHEVTPIETVSEPTRDAQKDGLAI